MEKFKLYLLSVTPLIVVSLIGAVVWFNLDSPKIKTISKNLRIIDANTDHNQALDVTDYAKAHGVKIPTTIINFDTHSDMYVYKTIKPNYGAHIYDWLNEYFAKNPEASVLYWVMPEEEALDKGMQEAFVDKDFEGLFDIMLGNSKKDPKLVNPRVDKVPYTQYFMLNTKNSWMYEIVSKKDEEPLLIPNSPYKKIKIITCTEKTLPDFKGENVVLSIDSDYIVNSGYDTTDGFKIIKDRTEIKFSISKLLNTIRKKHIRPEIISLTLSPKYVPNENQEQMYKFMQTFIKHSGKKDALKEYIHQADSPQIKEGELKYQSF